MDKYVKRVIIGLDEYGVMYEGFKDGHYSVYKLSDHAENEKLYTDNYISCIAYLNDLLISYLEDSI